MGTAAAIATAAGLSPRQVYEQRIALLQQTLLQDDAWLPGLVRIVPDLSRSAVLSATHGDPEPLRNGIDRPVGEQDNGWRGPLGAMVQYAFDSPCRVEEARFVFDSDLNRQGRNMRANYPMDQTPVHVPETMLRAFRLEACDAAGNWSTIVGVANNYQRLVRLKLGIYTRAIRFVPETTWGAPDAHVFGFEVS